MTDVSVIVIVYNDADRLPTAVRSVLDQSHRDVECVIVNDASTDATAQVADSLVAANPHRVRVVHRKDNSGGCGQPRNDGIEVARGTYLMFLDSDDTLDPHACRNMVATAEQTGAELVSGCCWRVFPDKGEERAWYRGVYRDRAVYASVRERPELLYDTLSTNKLYRRDFLDREGLRFVERLHYEDLLFSTQAYLAARMIAIIPHRVYNWMIYENAVTLSITNQRSEVRNFADRLEIFRRIDAVYARYGADDLKLRKDIKFLNHDLLLYIRGLRSRSTEYREAFVDLARDYMSTLDPRAFEEAHELQAIIGFMIINGDIEGAVSAADYVPRKGAKPRLTAPLVERDGRIYWSADHLDTEDGRSVLDVTDLGIHSLPLKSLNPGGSLTGIERTGATYRLTGDIVNPLGRIASDAKLKARLEIRDRSRKGRFFSLPATVTHTGGRIHWDADVRPQRDIRPLGFVDQSWGLRLRLTVGDEELIIRLFADHAMDDIALPVRPRLTRLAGDHLEAYVPESGELSFRLVAHGRVARAFLTALRGFTSSGRGRRWWVGLLRSEKSLRDVFTRRSTKMSVYNKFLIRLPIRRDTIVFESHLGKQYSDSPKYIYEELRRSGAKYTAIWSYAGSPSGYPKDAKLVRRGSWSYYLALARARYWVDNQGFPREAVKRPQTTYIQTWHGSAYKLMGVDAPETKRGTRAQRARLQEMVDRFDHFLIRTEQDAQTLVKGLGVRAELIRSGYPRNDALINGEDPTALRKKLKLTDGRKVVLYAPTFRTDERGRPEKRLEMPFDLERFAHELGETHILLVRPHYLNTVVVPPSLSGTVRNVMDVDDVSSLLLLTDTLITDYSSIMFDYALLDRPMVFFAPDLDDYTHSRGSYFDLKEHAPGPVVAEPDELFAALSDLDRDTYAKQRHAFVEKFGEYDQGTAAKQVVARFFTGNGNG